MGETRKIIVENYPAHKLPEDLRRQLGSEGTVKVTVERSEPQNLRRPLSEYVGAGKGLYATPEEALKAIRSLRDEWE
jgi:hypothetical protein